MDKITQWWAMLPWPTATLVVAIAIGLISIGFLIWDGYHHRRRFNRRVPRIRIAAEELDHAILTGQFYIPSQMKDRKGITK